MALKIVLFSDFICPFCYIGLRTVQSLRDEFDFELEWHGFQIHPEWPPEGMPASALGRRMDEQSRKAAWARIQGMADNVGLTMNQPSVLANSRLALEAAEYAQEIGRGEQFEERVYQAYFVEGANIGDTAILMRLGEESGINREDLAAALESGRYSQILSSNGLVARRIGINGVPTFFFGKIPVVGAQGSDVMRQVLRRAMSLAPAAPN